MRPENKRFKICRDELLVMPVVIYMRSNFYLTEMIDHKIEALVAAGLVELWQMQDIDIRFLQFKEPNYPKAIKFRHLMGSFYILFMGLFISFLVFLYELIKKKIYLL